MVVFVRGCTCYESLEFVTRPAHALRLFVDLSYTDVQSTEIVLVMCSEHIPLPCFTSLKIVQRVEDIIALHFEPVVLCRPTMPRLLLQ